MLAALPDFSLAWSEVAEASLESKRSSKDPGRLGKQGGRRGIQGNASLDSPSLLSYGCSLLAPLLPSCSPPGRQPPSPSSPASTLAQLPSPPHSNLDNPPEPDAVGDFDNDDDDNDDAHRPALLGQKSTPAVSPLASQTSSCSLSRLT